MQKASGSRYRFAVLTFLFCVGVAHVLYADRILRRSGPRKGGEMLIEFNRFGFRIAGIVLAAFSGLVSRQFSFIRTCAAVNENNPQTARANTNRILAG